MVSADEIVTFAFRFAQFHRYYDKFFLTIGYYFAYKSLYLIT